MKKLKTAIMSILAIIAILPNYIVDFADSMRL